MKSKVISWLLNVDDDKIIRRTTFWNLVTSVMNASYSAVLMFLIGHLVGMDDVGVFSIASAYAYQCLVVGAFGVRNIHASDVTNEFSFSDYLYLRMVSGLAMYLLLLYYTFFQGYDLNKIAIILLFGLFKSIEAIEDLFHGEYHRYNRLDIGSILQASRFIITLLSFAIILILTRDLVVSLSVSTLLSFLVCIMQNKMMIPHFVQEHLTINKENLRSLFLVCLPVCLSNYISTYIVNLPKYAIDEIFGDEMQSVYGILVLPVVTINMLSVVIYRPMINGLSRDYYDCQYPVFFKKIAKQIIVIVILTLLVIIGGYLIGLKLLGMIYGISLEIYMISFIIMLIGGGLNTVAAFLNVILTVQRAQNKLLIGYFVTALFGILASHQLILQFGLIGTALLYAVLSLCMCLLFMLFIYVSYKQKVRADQDE